MPTVGLNAKQQQFVNEYLIDLNATQAAIRAGYSKKNAHVIASRLLSNIKVAQALSAAKADRSDRTKIDADWVLMQLHQVWEADVSDIVDELGSFKPIKEWPKIWRKMLQGCDVEEVFWGTGKSKQKTGQIIKSRFIDRLRSLELIGKHIHVGAFEERLVGPGGGPVLITDTTKEKLLAMLTGASDKLLIPQRILP